jgi:hypothetical protein
MTGNKHVDYWTSGPVYECSEIAGSKQLRVLFLGLSCHPCPKQKKRFEFAKEKVKITAPLLGIYI